MLLYDYGSNMKKWGESNCKTSKEKYAGHKEAWEWLSQVIKWTSDALFNALAGSFQWGRYLIDKVDKWSWSKVLEIKNSREKIAKHHLDQSKKSFTKAWKWVWRAWKWAWHAAKWTIRTVYKSGKETIKWLREDDKSHDKSDK